MLSASRLRHSLASSQQRQRITGLGLAQFWHQPVSNSSALLPSASASCVSSSQLHAPRRLSAAHVSATAEPVASEGSSSPFGDLAISISAGAIVHYAINFARVSETYETHTWMLMLGLLRQEDCRAAKILKEMGLEDIYGAWNEVLWALNVSNGLEPRAFTPEIDFSDLAFRVLVGATNFAEWGGRQKVQSEDILMALAAGGVLASLFPDLKLTFEHVRKAAAKHGCKYVLPDDTEETQKEVEAALEDNFL